MQASRSRHTRGLALSNLDALFFAALFQNGSSDLIVHLLVGMHEARLWCTHATSRHGGEEVRHARERRSRLDDVLT
eukprot:scaffold7581_cov258-Pinguiococcus_pyrenoidosus.AAC.4